MPVEQIAACKGCGLAVIETRYVAPGFVWCPRCGGLNTLVPVEGGMEWKCVAPRLRPRPGCDDCVWEDNGCIIQYCNYCMEIARG